MANNNSQRSKNNEDLFGGMGPEEAGRQGGENSSSKNS